MIASVWRDGEHNHRRGGVGAGCVESRKFAEVDGKRWTIVDDKRIDAELGIFDPRLVKV